MARQKGNNPDNSNGNSDNTSVKEQMIAEGKVPPHSLEIEMNLLGGLIIDNNLIDTGFQVFDCRM